MYNFKRAKICDLNKGFSTDKQHVKKMFIMIDFEMSEKYDPTGKFLTTFIANPIIPTISNPQEIDLIIPDTNRGVIEHAQLLKTDANRIAIFMSQMLVITGIKTKFNNYIRNKYILSEYGKLTKKHNMGGIL